MRTYEEALARLTLSSYHRRMSGDWHWLVDTSLIAWVYEVPEKTVERAVEARVWDMVQDQADHVAAGKQQG